MPSLHQQTSVAVAPCHATGEPTSEGEGMAEGWHALAEAMRCNASAYLG